MDAPVTKEARGFDAVAFMRQARAKMNEEMRGMSFEEQQEYIRLHSEKVRQMLDTRREDAA